MLIKPPDDKSSDLATLNALLKRPGLYPATKERIEKSIRNMRSGMQGEAEAAYEMNFHFGNSDEWMILHDLRLEHDGRIAQIDHLVINRAMQFWVCESKSFSEGIAFNEHGECVAFRDGKPYGFASPIEQNRKHVIVLQDILNAGLVYLPKGKFFKMEPELESLILVSKGARITRPKKAFPGLETVVKNEQLKNYFDSAYSPVDTAGKNKKRMSKETLRKVADGLLLLHKPISFNWEAMLRVPPEKKSTRQASSFGTKKEWVPNKPKLDTNLGGGVSDTKSKRQYQNGADEAVSGKRVSTPDEVILALEDDFLPLPGWLQVAP